MTMVSPIGRASRPASGHEWEEVLPPESRPTVPESQRVGLAGKTPVRV